MTFTWTYPGGEAPLYSRAAGFGFIGGAEYAAAPELQIPEIGNGFLPLWWYGEALPTVPRAAAGGVQAAPAPALRAQDAENRRLPLRFRVEVPAEGVYRVRAVLCGTGGEVLLYTGRRRLAWRGALRSGEQITLTALCDVFPIVPRYHAEAAPCTAVEVTVVGAAALREVRVETEPAARRVWVLGDSTVTDQTADVPYAPGASYAGWGQMLPAFLPDGLCVTNHAHSGLTTESFTSEGHWDIVRPRLRAGDLCLLQFGHNDQKLPHLTARGGYTERLRDYLTAIRAAGAQPVLVTPVARNSWADPAHYRDFLADHAAAVLDLAKAEGVPVLDLHGWAMERIAMEGLEAAKRWFFPGDYTHSNDYGAYRQAAFVAAGLCRVLGCLPRRMPAWDPQPPFALPDPPADCSLTPPAADDPFAPYETERPGDALTRVEALALAIAALRYFPINVYNDLYGDVVGHEVYAGTVQCAAQNGMVPAAWVTDGCLHPDAPVTAADFLAVLMPGYAGRRVPGQTAAPPTETPAYARQAVAQALGEGLTGPEGLMRELSRRDAAAICRRLKI